MGQHKHNPTSQLARAGKLPPKSPKKQITKRQSETMVIGGLSALYPGLLHTLGRMNI